MTFTDFLSLIGDSLLDALLDSLKLLPFLFAIYLLLEFLEHKGGSRTEALIQKSGKAGPLFGGLLGVVPSCGFSAAVCECYAGRIVSVGTLFAVMLSASDEMLPVLLSEGAPVLLIVKILAFKVIVGVLVGFAIDGIRRLIRKEEEHLHIEDMCESEHCHCEKGILRSALHHSLHVFIFVFFVSLVLNVLIAFIGEDSVADVFTAVPFVGPFLGTLVGLIPNCAASVVLTELYLDGVISAGSMLGGLLAGAGVGILVLFRANRSHMAENFCILGGLYAMGTFIGLLVDYTPLSIIFA